MEIQVAENENGLEVLPLEMWREILGFLGIEDLLKSRLVCKDWRKLVEDDNLPKMWNPYFPKNQVGDALSLFGKKSIGTRLSSAEDVEQFMANAEGSPSNQDPFINGTLILNCNNTKQYHGLFQVFPTLVTRFGKDIRSCVYFVHGQVPESVRNISTILGLANLRYLTIYCQYWYSRAVQNSLMNCNLVAQDSRRLRSVTVMGNQDYEFLQVLSSTHGRHVKRLSSWGYNCGKDLRAPHLSPLLAFLNVEELKICDVQSEVFGLGHWPLKRFSLKLHYAENSYGLGHALKSLQHLARSLESFHLQMEQDQWTHKVFDEKFTFPKVSDFRVSYFGGKKYVNEFSKIFPNMKHFQLVDNDDLIPDFTKQNHAKLPTTSKDIKEVDSIGEEVKPLWEKLPEGLEMISVRYRKFREGGKVREQGFTVQRYFKNEV